MVTALLFALAVQQQIPSVVLTVDRTDVLTGDVVVATLTARSLTTTPAQILNPPFDGFEIVDQRDRSSVRIQGGVGTRETVRQVTLRALRPGRFAIGPAEVRQEGQSARSGTVDVVVRARGEGATLARRVADFAQTVRPPAIEPDQVAITVHAVPSSTIVGAQVDVVAIAWFPRSVRERLRTPPTLRGPQVAGAWVYHQYVPSAPAIARSVGGAAFDLYVLHDVMFPLRPGSVEIGAATVSFALPLSNALLSREVRHEVTSGVLRLDASPLPSGVSAGASVGRNLTWTVDLPRGELRRGDARVATVTVSGKGNVALWAEPVVAWPVGLRTYPEETQSEVQADADGMGGTKSFRYLVVAESTGTHRIPGPRYPYFDVARRALVTLEAQGSEVVTPGGPRTGPRVLAEPPALLDPSGARFGASWLVGSLDVWGWLALVLVPPLLGLWLRRRAPRLSRPSRRSRTAPSTLSDLAREFRTVLRALVPDEALREGDKLADALRAAGVEEPVAQHAVRVRDRLRQAVFGPDGTPDTEELVAEVHEVLRVMGGELTRAGVIAGPAVAALLLAFAAPELPGQTAARLYETGAYAAAADSFHHAALARPGDAAAWHNLAAALFELDDVVGARAAWTRAARLSPRSAPVREGMARLGAVDRRSAALVWVGPVTPAEALVIAGALWIAGWLLLGVKVRRRVAAPLLVLAVVAAGYAGLVERRYAEPVALAAELETVMLEAPYGSAPVVRRLEPGSAVRVLRARGAWLLVARGEERGWLRAAHVVAI